MTRAASICSWFLLINVAIVLSDPGGAQDTGVKVEVDSSSRPESSVHTESQKPGTTLRSVNAYGEIEKYERANLHENKETADKDTMDSNKEQAHNVMKVEKHSSQVRQHIPQEGIVVESKDSDADQHYTEAPSKQKKKRVSIGSILSMWGKAIIGDYEGHDEKESVEALEALEANVPAVIEEDVDETPETQTTPKQRSTKKQPSQREAFKKQQKKWKERWKHPLHKGHSHAMYDPADADMWLNFGAAVMVTLVLDVVLIRYVSQKLENKFSIPSWTVHLAFSLLASFAFSGYFLLKRGETACMSWLNGYMMEILLSVDNLLVFTIIFTSWKTPVEARYKPLMWGIFGAILIRLALFSTFQFFLDMHMAFAIILAAFLIYTGTMAIVEDDDDHDGEEQDYQNSLIITWMSKVFPAINRYEKDYFIFEGKLTILFFVAVCIEVTDVVFAIDSISAKVAQIPDGYTAYTSTVFAMFALRSLFWILDSFIRSFAYLKYGLALLMYYIGLKLVFPEYLDVPDSVFFMMISLVFALCVILTCIYPPAERKASKDKLSSSNDDSGIAGSSTDRVYPPQAANDDNLKKPVPIAVSD